MVSLAGHRVAVIGATGFIGSHLAQRLVGEGADVLSVARTAARLSHLAAVRVECTVAMADVCDADAMLRLMRRFRPEIVFYLAAHPDATESFAHVAESVRTNGIGLVNTLQAAVAAGTDVFVYGASAKDFGNAPVPYRATQPVSPICSYAIMKAAGWQLCQLVASFTPIKTVALRPTVVYGPRQNRNIISYVHECVTGGHPVRLMGGTQTRDPLYIDDAVRAFVAAATETRAWGQAIPIGGGQELTVISLCEAVVAALGTSVPVVAGAEQPRLTEIWRSSSDNVDAYRLLGWEPRVSLAEGLKRTVAALGSGNLSVGTSAMPRKRQDSYLYSAAPGVVYRMLDRRDGGDRRAAPRGGRRAEDALELVAAAPAHVGASPSSFHAYTALSGEKA
jgi:UDP-glucose 4-epimerase